MLEGIEIAHDLDSLLVMSIVVVDALAFTVILIVIQSLISKQLFALCIKLVERFGSCQNGQDVDDVGAEHQKTAR